MNGVLNEEYYPAGDYRLYFINQGTPVLDDSRFINIETKGLSKSRNFALDSLQRLAEKGDIIVLTDNDVCFQSGFDLFLRQKFQFCNHDVLTFKVKDIFGNPFKLNYSNVAFKHNIFSLMRVSSIEFAFKYTRLIDETRFDDQFGLGSVCPIGEENIFLTDLRKKHASIGYLPEFLCSHMDDMHSGSEFTTTLSRYRLKVFKRIYSPIFAYFVFTLFLVKNRNRLLGSCIDHLKVMK